ncbi:hypothetical protein AAMO2058_000862000 [Amorphochlora amoebiformis]|mmetsp:Transcript_9415/g.14885  ORF Transcript_9415/g.14885 Transcript_9415/m.14885 type:complete len:552 (-) Transcript_9415:49-1704(-)
MTDRGASRHFPSGKLPLSFEFAKPRSTPVMGTKGDQVQKLRSLVEMCIRQHTYDSAIFFADKLITLSKEEPGDMFLLAQAYFFKKEYRRAVHFLRENGLIKSSVQFALLAAQCLAAMKDWEECLTIIGEEKNTAVERDLPDGGEDHDISIKASICLTRGKVYEALENRERAVRWYKAALKADMKCFEALNCLVDKRMISYEEQRALYRSLEGKLTSYEWLKPLYQLKLQQHEEKSVSVDGLAASLSEEFGFRNNLDITTAQANQHYWKNRFQQAYDLTKDIVERDPFHHSVLPVHVCCLVELKMKTQLFFCAHHLVEAYPSKPISWFAVAAYYYLIEKYEMARRFFHKAIQLEQFFAPAWIGFGHSFAMKDESDQAMAAYRTATRLFRGSHVPLLCMGIEHLRTNSLGPARQFLQQAQVICPKDPLIFHEMGVISYKSGEFEDAIVLFRRTLDLTAGEAMEAWEPTFVNLAHAYRKRGMYAEAIKFYEKALSVAPRSPMIYTSLGFTHHLQGAFDSAIQYYHKSLGIHPNDTITADLLKEALKDAIRNFDL